MPSVEIPHRNGFTERQAAGRRWEGDRIQEGRRIILAIWGVETGIKIIFINGECDFQESILVL